MCGRLAKELEQQTSVMSEISQAKYALEFQKSRLATGLKRSGAMEILLNLHECACIFLYGCRASCGTLQVWKDQRLAGLHEAIVASMPPWPPARG